MQRRKLNISPSAEMFMTENGLELCNPTGYEVCFNGEWWQEYADHNANRYYKKRGI